MTVTTAKTLAIEETGLERVAESERQHGSARDILWLWVGANLTAPTLTVGLLSVVFGLGFFGSLTVIVIFTLLGSVPVAYLSTWGPKTGLAQMVISRYAFGYHGAKVPALLNALLGVGFIALNSIIGESFLESWSAGVIPPWLVLVALLAGSTIISLYGYLLLQRFEHLIWLFMAVPMMALLLVAGPHIHPGSLMAPALQSGIAGVAAVATFGGVVFAHTVAWGPIASDFTRRMPAETSAPRIFWYVLIGLVAPCILLELAGVLLTSMSGAGDPAVISSGPGLLVSRLLGNPLLSGVVVCAFTCSVIANNVPASYGLLSSFQMLGFRRIPRPVLALLAGTVYLLLALVLLRQFSEHFEHFLLLISYWLSAWLSIVVIEHWLRRGHYDLKSYEDARHLPGGLPALLAMALGLAIASLGVSQTLYVGPVAKALGGADLGYPLAFLASGCLYYPLRRIQLHLRRQRRNRKRAATSSSTWRASVTMQSFQQTKRQEEHDPLQGRGELLDPGQPVLLQGTPGESERGANARRGVTAPDQPHLLPMNWVEVLSTVRARQESDPTLVNLSRGDPLGADPEIYRAVDQANVALAPETRKALLESYSAGWPPLLDVFRERLSAVWDRHVAESELVVIPGITQTLKYLQQALRSRVTGLPGLPYGPLRLLFPVGGLEYPGMGDARNPLLPSIGPFLTEDFSPDLFRIRLASPALLDWQDVGALVLSQPHITGRLWAREELLPLADEARAQGAVFVLDEAESSPFAPLSKVSPPLIDHPSVLHLFTMSKVGFPGLRIGVAVGSSALIGALRPLIQDQIIQTGARSQHDAWAAIRAFEQKPATAWFGERYAERWHIVASALRGAGALDDEHQVALWEGGPYAWYGWRSGPTSQEVFTRMLDQAQVAVCPSSALQMGVASPIRGIRIGLGAVQATEAFEDVLGRLAPVLTEATFQQPPQTSQRVLDRRAAVNRVLRRGNS